jgi:hypothetical protein
MNENVTEEIPAVDLRGEDADWDWPARAARRGLRMRVPTAVLIALLIAAGGIWGGAALQRTRSSGSSSSASSLASLFSGLRGRGGTTGTGGGSPFGSAPTAEGTVTAVEGDVVYLTTSSGGIEKVIIGKTTSLTRTAKVSASGLRQGDTVIVEGTTEKNGSVAATSITASAAGVSALGGLGSRLGATSPSG